MHFNSAIDLMSFLIPIFSRSYKSKTFPRGFILITWNSLNSFSLSDHIESSPDSELYNRFLFSPKQSNAPACISAFLTERFTLHLLQKSSYDS